MKCPHCNGDHPNNFKYCPVTGKEIELKFKACTNNACSEFGKYVLPLEAKFCPNCGKPIQMERKNSFQKGRMDYNHSRIVVVCSGGGSFIQIGQWTEDDELQREKRIRLRKGENIISVEKYPELKYGFSFDSYTDKPEQVEDIILDEFDTSKIIYMCFMFEGCSSLESLDLSGFDTSNVTDMRDMFFDCSSLESLDLSGFDTSNVTDMRNMFSRCSSLESLDLSCFDTSNVTDMSGMFFGCSSLESLDLSSFDTSNVTDMSWMFRECDSLKSLDLSGFDTSNVTDMGWMFSGCSSLEYLDLDGFDTSNACTDSMFDGCREEIQEEYEYLL